FLRKRLLANPHVDQITSDLSSADADANAALTASGDMDYLSAAIKAKSAYDKVLAAAAQMNVEPRGLDRRLSQTRDQSGTYRSAKQIDPLGKASEFDALQQDAYC